MSGSGGDYRQRVYAAYTEPGRTGARTAAERAMASRQFASRWRAWVPADHAAPILDVGCGAGLFVDWLRQAGYTNVTGIDVSPEEVARAAEAGIRGIVRADARVYLADTRERYGLIAVLNVFEHLGKDEVLSLLELLHEALLPGGRVIAVTPNGLSPFGGATRYWDFSHELSFTPSSWRQLARMTGFPPPVFEEYGPLPHSLAGRARCVLWRALALGIEAAAWIEVGGPRDPSRVYTADLKVILTR